MDERMPSMMTPASAALRDVAKPSRTSATTPTVAVVVVVVVVVAVAVAVEMVAAAVAFNDVPPTLLGRARALLAPPLGGSTAKAAIDPGRNTPRSSSADEDVEAAATC